MAWPLMQAVPGFDRLGVVAFTTTRQAGDFNLGSLEPSAHVQGRWQELSGLAGRSVDRLAVARQVHGIEVLVHDGRWSGLLRGGDADGHFSMVPSTLMAVTLADCVPVFIGHHSGAAAVLHSGWKGTAVNIVSRGIALFASFGFNAGDLTVHCGPAICGRCYEVGPDVYNRLMASQVDRPTSVDLRRIIAGQARAAGVRNISISDWCTRCHNDQFFSHRCGDVARQVGVIVASTGAREVPPATALALRQVHP